MRNLPIKILSSLGILTLSVAITFGCAYLNQFANEKLWYGDTLALWCWAIGVASGMAGVIGSIVILVNDL